MEEYIGSGKLAPHKHWKCCKLQRVVILELKNCSAAEAIAIFPVQDYTFHRLSVLSAQHLQMDRINYSVHVAPNIFDIKL